VELRIPGEWGLRRAVFNKLDAHEETATPHIANMRMIAEALLEPSAEFGAHGKLSALRWVMGDDWDMLDTSGLLARSFARSAH